MAENMAAVLPKDEGYLVIDQVVKDFGASASGGSFRAVDNVSLHIAQGEIFALLGSSGCGKTTLLRLLAGFETPTSGRISLGGQDLLSLAPYERPLNMMFQSYALFPHLTVWDNIAFGLRRQGMAKGPLAERVEAMLKLVQLTKFAQRKLLLLDEPLGALDKKLREETQLELVNIIEGVGVTVVMVTHDQEEAMTMASRIGVMSEGRILQVGTPREIYETPATRFVADFIGNVNLMDGTLAVDEPSHVEIACADVRHHVGHGISGHEGMKVSVAIRPEKIRISRHAPIAVDGNPHGSTNPPMNQVQGVVKDLSYMGSHTVYRLSLPSGAMLKVSQSNTERHPDDALTWGDAAWAWWSPSAAVVLTS
jgi:putrescine transport system ATP-binding protein